MALIGRALCCQPSGRFLLERVDFHCKQGKLYLVVGPNGAGKTSLLKAVAGLLPLTQGKLTWQGNPIDSLSRQARSQLISYVPPLQPLPFDFSVEEFVAMGCYATATRYQLTPGRLIEKVLDQVDLLALRHHLVGELSTGERQRAYIARSLIGQAPIILMDEPFSSLDLRHQLELWELLTELVELQNRLLLISHHDLRSALDRPCELILLDQGSSLLQTEPTALLFNSDLMARFFGVVAQESPELSFRFSLASDGSRKVATRKEIA